LAQAASRFHLHFTATSGSWLNMVERFFAEITRKRIRRGVFKSVDELKHNGHPKPYVWTKTAAEIFSKVAGAKQALESQHLPVSFKMLRFVTLSYRRDL
jgi:hypothetical protein